jgi:hypothetical protein
MAVEFGLLNGPSDGVLNNQVVLQFNPPTRGQFLGY